MCKAMEDLREEGRTEGEIIGAIIMCKKLKQTIDDTIVAIADQFNLSKDEAEFVVKSHWEM